MLLRDPRWLAIDLDVARERYSMIRIDAQTLAQSSFLDTRIEMPPADITHVALAEVQRARLDVPPPAWLWHTSFCCSTLLARMLHLTPWQVCLKEPLSLRRLGDARLAGIDVDRFLAPTVALLSRPWHADGAVVIKPTHAALNVAEDLMRVTPGSRALVITSTLRDFLVSNLKKTVETQSRVALLADRALRATELRHRLAADAFQPPDLLCCVALQWAAQQELLFEIEQRLGPTRLRWLQENDLLAAMPRTVRDVADWLRLPAPWRALESHVADAGRRNAKALAADYGPARRAREAMLVMQLHGAAIDKAMDWAAKRLRPAMRSTRALFDSAPGTMDH